MTARMLRWLLLVQACAGSLLAYAGWRWLGSPPAVAALLGLAAVLGVRLAISSITSS